MAEMTLDLQERKIIAQLVRNPRVSDNQISRQTKIPLNTVNRKRKGLEARGLISYMAKVEYGPYPPGTGTFGARVLYMVTLRTGVTRASFLEFFRRSEKLGFLAKHTKLFYMGERDGKVLLVMLIESRLESDIIDIFNAELIRWLESQYGLGCVSQVEAVTLHEGLQVLHNYFQGINMQHGSMKSDWPDSRLYLG